MRLCEMFLSDVWSSDDGQTFITLYKGHSRLHIRTIMELAGEDRRLSAQWETL